MKRIYFDIAATTPIDTDVADFMHEISLKAYGNPSSIHKHGQESRAIIERARLQVSNALGCNIGEIIFTGSGTESNNIAIQGILEKGDHFIYSGYEHPAVSEVAKKVEKSGIHITCVQPNSDGCISTDDILKELTEQTKLVSVMYVNNEIGTVNPINEISKECRERKILFHTDAVQAIGKKAINLKESSIDLLSLSSHKFYGPKGMGALFIRDGIELFPTLLGGGQEKELSPGTENISGIAGMGLAISNATSDIEKNHDLIMNNEKIFFEELKKLNVPYTLNGGVRLGGIMSITFHEIKSQDLVMALDLNGFAISGGSACSSGSVKASEILLNIGLSSKEALETVRISIGKSHTSEEVIALANEIKQAIEKISNAI